MNTFFFFIAVEPEFSCEYKTAILGEPLNFTCQFSTNPSADYFTVELPDGQIVSGPTSNIAFSVISQEVSTGFTSLNIIACVNQGTKVSTTLLHFAFPICSDCYFACSWTGNTSS